MDTLRALATASSTALEPPEGSDASFPIVDPLRPLFADAFEALLWRSEDFVLLLDDSYTILAASNSFATAITGGHDPAGRRFLDLLDSGCRTKAQSFLDGLTERPCLIELNHPTASRVIRLASYGFCRFLTREGPRIVAVGRDQEAGLRLVEKLVQLNGELDAARCVLAQQALTDPLTGLGNHRWLFDRLDALWAAAQRSHELVWLMMADLDHFKAINDTFGHQAGDEVLKAAARTLREAVRAGDLVARYGGEEFILAGTCSDFSEPCQMADRLLDAIRSLRLQIPSRLTISLGVALSRPVRSDPPARAIHAADQALYRAKAQGRDRCEIDPEILGGPESLENLGDSALRVCR